MRVSPAKARLSVLAIVALGLAACAPTANDQLASAPPPPPHAAPAEAVQMAEAPAAATPVGLPEGPGRETTIRVCSGCHEVELVMHQRLTRQEWFDLVQFMGDRGAMGTPAEFAEITDYLAEHFPKS